MQAARQISPQQSRGIKNRPYRNSAFRQDPQARFKRVKLLTLLLACFLLSLVVVAQYSSLVMTSYRLSSAQRELAAIQESTRQLEIDVAKLSSVGVLEEIARTELGMVEPELAQLRMITASRTLTFRVGE